MPPNSWIWRDSLGIAAAVSHEAAATRRAPGKVLGANSGHQVIDEQPAAVADLLERYAAR